MIYNTDLKSLYGVEMALSHHGKLAGMFIHESTPAELHVYLNIMAEAAEQQQKEYADKTPDTNMPRPPQGIE